MASTGRATAHRTLAAVLWGLAALIASVSGLPSQEHQHHLQPTTKHSRTLLQSYLSRIPRCNYCKIRAGGTRGICRRNGRVWQCRRRRGPARRLQESDPPPAASSDCPLYAVEDQPQFQLLGDECVDRDRTIGQITRTIQWDLFIDEDHDEIRDIIIMKARRREGSYLWLAKDGGYLDESQADDVDDLRRAAQDVDAPTDVGQYWFDAVVDPWIKAVYGPLLGPSVSNIVRPFYTRSPPPDRGGTGTTDTRFVDQRNQNDPPSQDPPPSDPPSEDPPPSNPLSQDSPPSDPPSKYPPPSDPPSEDPPPYNPLSQDSPPSDPPSKYPPPSDPLSEDPPPSNPLSQDSPPSDPPFKYPPPSDPPPQDPPQSYPPPNNQNQYWQGGSPNRGYGWGWQPRAKRGFWSWY